MSPLPRVALPIWLWPWRIRFSLFLSLSLYFPSGFLTSLYFSLTPPLFNPLYHPTLFCHSTALAQPSFPSLNFCSSPRGAVAEQPAVPYQTLSDVWRNGQKLGDSTSAAKNQRCITDNYLVKVTGDIKHSLWQLGQKRLFSHIGPQPLCILSQSSWPDANR